MTHFLEKLGSTGFQPLIVAVAVGRVCRLSTSACVRWLVYLSLYKLACVRQPVY